MNINERRDSDRTIVKPNTFCQIKFYSHENSITALLENISKGGAALCLGDSNVNKDIKEDMKGLLTVEPYLNEKITVAWYLYGRIGLMFDNKIADDVIKYYQNENT